MLMTWLITKIEDDPIKRLNVWKDNVKNKGMKVNIKKTNRE